MTKEEINRYAPNRRPILKRKVEYRTTYPPTLIRREYSNADAATVDVLFLLLSGLLAGLLVVNVLLAGGAVLGTVVFVG